MGAGNWFPSGCGDRYKMVYIDKAFDGETCDDGQIDHEEDLEDILHTLRARLIACQLMVDQDDRHGYGDQWCRLRIRGRRWQTSIGLVQSDCDVYTALAVGDWQQLVREEAPRLELAEWILTDCPINEVREQSLDFRAEMACQPATYLSETERLIGVVFRELMLAAADTVGVGGLLFRRCGWTCGRYTPGDIDDLRRQSSVPRRLAA